MTPQPMEMRDHLGGIDPAAEKEEHRELQTGIEAAAIHTYDLQREDTKFSLDEFYRVENPRLMDEVYFEMVQEKYDMLAEEAPTPNH